METTFCAYFDVFSLFFIFCNSTAASGVDATNGVTWSICDVFAKMDFIIFYFVVALLTKLLDDENNTVSHDVLECFYIGFLPRILVLPWGTAAF